jgi:CheY-like chemotaxis protein
MHPPRILAVDDAPEILALVEKILTSQGYQVIAAGDGAAAIAACQQAGGEIDLLVTDIMMPGISGVELAENLTATYPAIPVLLISGQCDESVMKECIRRFRFLAKPFLPLALLGAVKEALAQRDLRRKNAGSYTDCSKLSA